MSDSFSSRKLDLEFVVEPQIIKCGGPIFFTRSSELSNLSNVVANGSFGLVDTGKMKLLVTCHHVWAEFESLRQIYPKLRIGIGLNPDALVLLDHLHPIDQDERLDLVSFDMLPLVEKIGAARFFLFDGIKASQLKLNDRLAFIGYPGRIPAENPIEIRFFRSPYLIRASDMNASFVVSNLANVCLPKNVPPLKYQSTGRGGISGSPCFLILPNLTAHLVAFATSEAMNLLKMTRASCLNVDGTFNRS
jgi:hypothetical protein